MNETSRTDWKRLQTMTDSEATANALADADNPPVSEEIPLRLLHLPEDGATLLERFHKALEQEKKVSLTVRYDADIVRWYKSKGKGYQSAMNAALRSVMEAERQAAL